MLGRLLSWNGRIGRGQWWLVQLIAIPVVYIFGFSVLFGVATAAEGEPDVASGGAILAVAAAALILGTWLNIVSTVKRYHDRDKPGVWFLIVFVPLIGGLWQIIECGFCSGTDGDNTYGSPPGSEAARENFDREISGLATSGGRLDKLDDEYFRKYATQAAPQSEPVVQSTYNRPAFSSGNSGPVFGRR